MPDPSRSPATPVGATPGVAPDALPDTTPVAGPGAGLGLFGGPASATSGRPEAADGPPMCSRKGCRNDAGWSLLWNNPRIHTPERRKAWAACAEHVSWFEVYLGERGLWKETRPLGVDASGPIGLPGLPGPGTETP